MAEASCAGAPPIKRLLDHQARAPGPVHHRLQHGSGSLAPRPRASPDEAFVSFAHAAPNLPPLSFQHQPSRSDSRLAIPLLPPARSSPPSVSRTQEPSVPSWALEFGRFEATHDAVTSPRPLDRLPVQPPALLPLHAAAPPSALTPSSFHRPVPFLAPSSANLGLSIESDFASDLNRWMSSHGAQDMAPVDAALESLARQLELNEAPVPATTTTTTTTTEATTCPLSSASHLSDLDGPELENLPPSAVIPPPADLASHRFDEGPPRPQTPDQASPTSAPPRSAVAELASRLLEAVDHEDGQKWQQSTFLSLMRDFKHGREDIVDNEICSMGRS